MFITLLVNHHEELHDTYYMQFFPKSPYLILSSKFHGCGVPFKTSPLAITEQGKEVAVLTSQVLFLLIVL